MSPGIEQFIARRSRWGTAARRKESYVRAYSGHEIASTEHNVCPWTYCTRQGAEQPQALPPRERLALLPGLAYHGDQEANDISVDIFLHGHARFLSAQG